MNIDMAYTRYKTKLPLFQFVSFIIGKRLIKEGYKKCENGEQIFLTVRYLCHIDFNKNKIIPLRRANKKEK